jgi:putative molybdopterin biosynthesis protein
MQLFTTSEAAAYLRLKERKIYEMVAEGTVPCTKVTGRWLFPKTELDQWLGASVTRPAGSARAAPPAIAAGSHDPLLEWALRESGSGVATLAVGSEAGLARFAASEALAACMHLHALDDVEADANVAAMKSRGDMQDSVLIAFCRREQGFLVAVGNPLKLKSIEDVITKGADRIRRCPGDPRRSRRCRHCDARCRQHDRPRLYADCLGAFRSRGASARLFPRAIAGVGQILDRPGIHRPRQGIRRL